MSQATNPVLTIGPALEILMRRIAEAGSDVLIEPRIGAHGTLIFFVHPKDMQGVLTEIMEVPPVVSGAGH